jgi:hypothetical protein
MDAIRPFQTEKKLSFPLELMATRDATEPAIHPRVLFVLFRCCSEQGAMVRDRGGTA